MCSPTIGHGLRKEDLHTHFSSRDFSQWRRALSLLNVEPVYIHWHWNIPLFWHVCPSVWFFAPPSPVLPVRFSQRIWGPLRTPRPNCPTNTCHHLPFPIIFPVCFLFELLVRRGGRQSLWCMCSSACGFVPAKFSAWTVSTFFCPLVTDLMFPLLCFPCWIKLCPLITLLKEHLWLKKCQQISVYFNPLWKMLNYAAEK